MIEFVNVTKRFEDVGNIALENASFKIENGEFVFLVGSSGAGKTTITKLIMRETNVTEGQVVAKSGISGNAKGLQGLDQHLHFELRSLPENIKGLTGKLDPNTVVDTKFISQDPEVRPQTQVGIIKIYKDGTEEYKDVIR